MIIYNFGADFDGAQAQHEIQTLSSSLTGVLYLKGDYRDACMISFIIRLKVDLRTEVVASSQC